MELIGVWIGIGLQTLMLFGGAWRYITVNDRRQEARHAQNQARLAVIEDRIKMILDGRVRIDRR